MSLCQNCDDTRIEYVGNGVQRDFTFPFEYNKESDIEVAFWDETTESWSQISDSLWNFQNATTIRFNTAPANGQKLAIYRCTDIDPLPAEFYPGTPIKAQDLNDNFFVLRNAVEEAKCGFGNTGSGGGGGGGGPVTNTIKYGQQVNGQADSYLNDSYVFSASASAARHDSYVQPNTPLPLTYEQDGKIWNDTNDLKHYFWDAENNTWVNWSSGGSPGPEGPAGPPGSVIVSDSAPVEYVESGSTVKRPLRDGDLWFDSYQVLLYMWYTDATSGQWVSVSIPGPKGDSGGGGGGGGDFSGDYNDLTNKPTIGDGIITIKQGGVSKGQFSVNQITPTEILLDAGGGGSDFSGDYNDLTNKPTIGSGVITINQGGTLKGQFNVNQTGATTIDLVEGDTFSGDYNDLTNKPTIPTVGNGIITVNQGGVQKGQFTTNQSSATNINLDAIPTVGNGIITITQGGVSKGAFSVNQTGPTTIDLDAGGGATGDFVKLDDEGTAQSITGGGGLNVEFGTDTAQLGNIAPMNDWSCYPART